MTKPKRRTREQADPETGCQYYVVHTESRGEFLAAGHLRRLGFDVLNLWYQRAKKNPRRGKVSVLRLPYFPRYIFCGADPGQSFYDVKSCRGVSTLVYGTEGPYLVSPCVIDHLRGLCAPDGLVGGIVEATEQRRRYPAGQRLRIMEGPLTGYDATVLVDNGRSVWLDSGEFLGRIEVAADALVAVTV